MYNYWLKEVSSWGKTVVMPFLKSLSNNDFRYS